ncbi:MAG: SDR family oxidoreductase [Betaproteobacteria bacterium]|nr:SDR family oxidoreductase [Betaproteobacteria bacterium]
MMASSIGDDFPDGVALVVGASGGIGQGVAHRLAASGCRVVLTYRRGLAAAQACADQIQAAGGQAELLQLSLDDLSAVQSALGALVEQQGALHTVVYAVGADISMTYVANIDPDEWHRTIDGDLNGFFNVIKAALPLMRKAGGASFVAITTAGLDRHPPLDILSTVPKAGIEALIRGIAREEGRFGIRANSVAPGIVDGGLFDRLRERVTPEFVEAMKRNTALRRFGSIEEIADVAVFLASRRAGYVTGQHLAVDGGYSV